MPLIRRKLDPYANSTILAELDPADTLDNKITKTEDFYGIPSGLLHSVIKQESGGNPNAISPVGAIGLGQLMPQTAKSLDVNPYDPDQNLVGAGKYLSQQVNHFGGNTTLGTAAYNAGPGAVEKYNGVPPYPETQNYTKSVNADWTKNKASGGGAGGQSMQNPDNFDPEAYLAKKKAEAYLAKKTSPMAGLLKDVQDTSNDIQSDNAPEGAKPMTTLQKIYYAAKLGPAVTERVLDNPYLPNPIKSVTGLVRGFTGGLDKPVENAADYGIQKAIGLNPNYDQIKNENAQLYQASAPSELLGALSPESIPSKIFGAVGAVNPIQQGSSRLMNLLSTATTGAMSGVTNEAANNIEDLARGDPTTGNYGTAAIVGGVAPTILQGALETGSAAKAARIAQRIFSDATNTTDAFEKDPEAVDFLMNKLDYKSGNASLMDKALAQGGLAQNARDEILQNTRDLTPEEILKSTKKYIQTAYPGNVAAQDSALSKVQSELENFKINGVKPIFQSKVIEDPNVRLEVPKQRPSFEEFKDMIDEGHFAKQFGEGIDSEDLSDKDLKDSYNQIFSPNNKKVTSASATNLNEVKSGLQKQAASLYGTEQPTINAKTSQKAFAGGIREALEKASGDPEKLQDLNKQIHYYYELANSMGDKEAKTALEPFLTKTDVIVGAMGGPHALIAKKLMNGVPGKVISPENAITLKNLLNKGIFKDPSKFTPQAQILSNELMRGILKNQNQ